MSEDISTLSPDHDPLMEANSKLQHSAESTNDNSSPKQDITNGSPVTSTISQIVEALSPTSTTTSSTHTNIITSTNSQVDNSSTLQIRDTTKPIPAQPGVKFTQTDDLKASFTGVSNKNTDPISMVLPDADSDDNDKIMPTSSSILSNIGSSLGIVTEKDTTSTSKNPIVKSSPLLSSTPLTVSKSLIKSYPFLILVLKVLNILTWNDDSYHLSIFLVLITILSILYYQPLIIYTGHLLPVFAIWVYSECKNYVNTYQAEHSTLDDIIQTMTLISKRANILISPIVELDLTAGDLKRLLFTTVFLSPLYVVISFFILPPNKMLLTLSVLTLTYHSKWSKVTRSLLWKSRSFRLLCFYLTGLDFQNSGLSKASALFNLNKRLSKRFGKDSRVVNADGTVSNSKSSVRFTYVIYENQRRWLGVGWTPNLLSYERTPWTDDFLNESESIDSFELPQLPLSIDIQDLEKPDGSSDDSINTKGMVWRWIDKTWRLDLTNDGAIQLPSTKPQTTANPKPDDGWIYYDNTWKNPSTEDGFSKYTRRRRWIRTAELVYVGNDDAGSSPKKSGKNSTKTDKSVRFQTDEAIQSHSEDNTDLTDQEEETITRSGSRKNSTEVKKRKSLRFQEPSG
ncbi:hypothetical protein CANINC_002539 [Pichia inconspicua]|uniref:Peroxin/Ferlin domain-containing protein n=1 Tax=Pichia inconspicua TaxID=52247 RepID=A0A4T0X1C9_9ASCO|nr:hypothetical protein CANINC_002539 [[Candida] inconspicua]